MHLFRCPECNRDHAQPARADFVLTVICLDCAFWGEAGATRRPAVREKLAAAA